MLNHRFGHNIFLAGLVGFLLGILFSFTVWAGNRVIQNTAALQELENQLPSLIFDSFSVAVTSPTESATVDDATVTITGTTSSYAVVLISGGEGDVVVDSDGRFETNYILVEGQNDLTISAIDEFGHQGSASRSIFYTEEEIIE